MTATGESGRITEDRLRRVAFGDQPSIDERVLAAAARGAARSRWLAAVVLGAQGRYAAAATLLGELIRTDPPLVGGLACATLAAHRRQLGGHAAALPLDGAALLRAGRADAADSWDPDGIDLAGARADALLGLAADNLALGRPDVSRRLLAAADPDRAGWRGRVRAGWVRAEVELVCGNPGAAVPPAEASAQLAAARTAVRHGVKSDLVLAAALAATGETAARQRAAELADGAAAVAGRHGLRSLAWPAGLIAADLEPTDAERHRSQVTDELYAVLLATDPAGRRLARESPWVPW
ncbi:hypothetical protein SAMN05216266_108113 [Amycolatopsis marina]|uniref:Tetratricopeptide repeat-containing protein n=1 Tax=Amycolatopsis marina TaxID=490629 RepID=A0A1I1A1Z2_9PSEU|nr:hypothetical protein [Amycolatopsis marina]SFB32009.1 hypothetical protein SAMN05216266_108113 [Amycolatopsis marina]